MALTRLQFALYACRELLNYVYTAEYLQFLSSLSEN